MTSKWLALMDRNHWPALSMAAVCMHCAAALIVLFVLASMATRATAATIADVLKAVTMMSVVEQVIVDVAAVAGVTASVYQATKLLHLLSFSMLNHFAPNYLRSVNCLKLLDHLKPAKTKTENSIKINSMK